MNYKLTCIIVEDEMPSAEELKYILSQYKNILVQNIAHNGELGLKLVKDNKPDAVFIDINIPLKNGMELAKDIKKFNKEINIIFITAYEEYAIEAFKLYALDYILKPFDEKRIDITINRLLGKCGESFQENQNTYKVLNSLIDKINIQKNLIKKIPCEENGKIVLINIQDVFFCYTKDEKTYIKTKTKRYQVGYTLCQIQSKTNFFRAHRSYIVNMDNVKEMYSWFNGTYKLVMDDVESSEVPISRNNVKSLKEYFKI
ncbi:response regulator [Clostridium tyrobutyricum]|jgi:two-component system response regulator LytT|uniref:Stage 0 sporulation protein A homolog n=1 Tax=Clostridium tyrobutyricum DIVETGP TaxID=1408889 RepID=W6N5C2_CLOTY|nr:LytTR family DNA-binding domain-containing protein [Clostridium tyrobutyricum]AND85885.1 response regulator [Clostridium tyrobutyricum]ANP70398.1 DNA-binding response regulator [Clostridium tyrobutyricum]MBR9648222.1 response regulator transcription factor [Clostridium tyrobutyricum]MBV4414640.1 LytTR family DNA-binding domain-containing protein [Clostridium tyrobutyricum]MBV4422613.1 LytTR family DNA-binding domain-containing protein [Clostridium tyrobutyricum]